MRQFLGISSQKSKACSLWIDRLHLPFTQQTPDTGYE
jgi:hypothetical protein